MKIIILLFAYMAMFAFTSSVVSASGSGSREIDLNIAPNDVGEGTSAETEPVSSVESGSVSSFRRMPPAPITAADTELFSFQAINAGHANAHLLNMRSVDQSIFGTFMEPVVSSKPPYWIPCDPQEKQYYRAYVRRPEGITVNFVTAAMTPKNQPRNINPPRQSSPPKRAEFILGNKFYIARDFQKYHFSLSFDVADNQIIVQVPGGHLYISLLETRTLPRHLYFTHSNLYEQLGVSDCTRP